MKTKIIMPLLAIMLLLAACNRQPADDEAAAKAAARAAKASAKATALASVPAVLHQTVINPDNVFSVIRSGNQVHIQWVPDFSSCKSIAVFRNTTGVPRNKFKAALLPASQKEYDDTLPDGRAYWYWLEITLPDAKTKNIGPLRVPSDESNMANYVPVSDDFDFTVRRDGDSSVILAWNLPDTIKYTSITILRNINPKFHKKTNPRKKVTTTKEWHGEFVDKLTDTQADYWYWIDVVRENGSTISKGPIKAEY